MIHLSNSANLPGKNGVPAEMIDTMIQSENGFSVNMYFMQVQVLMTTTGLEGGGVCYVAEVTASKQDWVSSINTNVSTDCAETLGHVLQPKSEFNIFVTS